MGMTKKHLKGVIYSCNNICWHRRMHCVCFLLSYPIHKTDPWPVIGISSSSLVMLELPATAID